mmetsp:Transcript_34305/g.67558  ORF Transcript_34305/g.67558 Transcript_34305/m.67558 type:complete len:133 (-) Transcript_34305:644-1042(-)
MNLFPLGTYVQSLSKESKANPSLPGSVHGMTGGDKIAHCACTVNNIQQITSTAFMFPIFVQIFFPDFFFLLFSPLIEQEQFADGPLCAAKSVSFIRGALPKHPFFACSVDTCSSTTFSLTTTTHTTIPLNIG